MEVEFSTQQEVSNVFVLSACVGDELKIAKLLSPFVK